MIKTAGMALFWAGIGVLVLVALLAMFASPDALHVSPETTAAYTAVASLLWYAFLIASLLALVTRILRYRRAGIKTPELLWRDLISKTGLAMPISLVLLARLAMAQAPAAVSPISSWLPWMLWTTLPPILGMGTFLYYEWFVIDHWQGGN